MRLMTGLALLAMTGGALGAVWVQQSMPGMSVASLKNGVASMQSTISGMTSNMTTGAARSGENAPAKAPASETLSDAAPAAVKVDNAPVRMAQASPKPQAAPAAAPAPAPPPVAKVPACDKPGALGTARIVEIDTTGGPGFGFEHFKMHDFLRDKEVVLTFDDGPWPNNTPAVLKALGDECVKATFFPIGKHATYYPEILKKVVAEGHTVGSHTWSHANLNRVKGEQVAKEEIEKGFSAVRFALGANPSPFFRFPALQHPPAMVTYLGERNVGIFSTDMDSFDFKTRKPEQVVQNVMKKLEKFGKGIILMHDFQHNTAVALPDLLAQLKAGGYKVVHLTARAPIKTIAQYDEELVKDLKLPTVSGRPTSSVVRTVGE